MEITDIVLLKSGFSSDVDILRPEEQEDILDGATKCDQGYRHSIFLCRFVKTGQSCTPK